MSCKQKDLIVMEADVIEYGRTSIRIKLDAYIWNGPSQTTWEKVCTAKAVFVSMKGGTPHPHGRKKRKKN
jgi:acyl-CoA hydrolase